MKEEDRPVLRSRFATWEEWGAWVNGNCPPARADDLPVFAGQVGPRRRATRDELIAYVKANNARYAREHPER